MHPTTTRFLLLSLLYASQTPAAEPETGPVVKGYGPVYEVPADSFNLDPVQHYKVVMDIAKGLLEALGAAGVKIYICGQTAAYYGYAASDLLPQVSMAVSAMSVHVRLQQEDYRAILF